MAEIEGRANQELRCHYLREGGEDLAEGVAAFVSLDLTTGDLQAHATGDEFATTAPALVSACWRLRWPIAPVCNDQANLLLDSIAPSARKLLCTAIVREGELGMHLVGGAGQSIDAIQRLCATTWVNSA